MNTRRVAEAVANIAHCYHDMKLGNAAVAQHLANRIDAEFHTLLMALDLEESEAQRFKAHFDKQMYGR